MKIRALIALSALSLAACDQAKAPEPTSEAPAEQKPEAAEAAEAAPAAPKAEDPHAAFTDLSPEQVDALLAEKDCVPVDANDADTRAKYGVLPGAVQLSSYADFQASELPEDKATKLVFYCGGHKCTAAPKAAKLAQEAGYRDVAVMRAGIRGWVDAGKKVDKPST